MSSSTMTLIGLYNYDPDLFEYLTFPEGIDKSTFIDNLLLRADEFEVLYPDPEFLKFSIGAWSRKWQATFTRWVEALAIEYAPLENYDRHEDWTDKGNSHGSNSGESSGETGGRTNSTSTNKVSAYDSGDALTTHHQDVLVGADSTSSSSASSGSHEEHFGNTHNGRIHGNIGVTTSQQMLTAELDLGYWNIYNKIIDLFLTEFVIPVY